MLSSSRKPEEKEAASESDEALEEVNSHIKEVFDILKRETLKVRKERETFDTVAKKLKHVHFSKTLKLNVGGQLFSTSLETMKKDPGILFYIYLTVFLIIEYINGINTVESRFLERRRETKNGLRKQGVEIYIGGKILMPTRQFQVKRRLVQETVWFNL